MYCFGIPAATLGCICQAMHSPLMLQVRTQTDTEDLAFNQFEHEPPCHHVLIVVSSLYSHHAGKLVYMYVRSMIV